MSTDFAETIFGHTYVYGPGSDSSNSIYMLQPQTASNIAHVVTADGCSGEPSDPNVDRLAHYVYDRFAWFEEVSVCNIAGVYHIVIIHNYPPEIDIAEYARGWIQEHVRAPLAIKFSPTSAMAPKTGEQDHAIRQNSK